MVAITHGRYFNENDQLEGREGVFGTCSFWLVECLAYQGRLKEAHEVFEQVIIAGNDLYLFPQGLSHLSLIAATFALAAMEDKKTLCIIKDFE